MKGADFNSSHRDKSVTLDFPHYYEDALIDKYYALPPLLPCFRPSQPHNECGYESPTENDNVDIESMTIAEYYLYVAKRGLEKNPLNDHSYGFRPQFFTQPPRTSNTHVDKKDSALGEILDDLFKIGAENLRRIREEKIQNGVCEQDVDLEKEEPQVEHGDDRDTYDIWDITVEDVELIRQLLTPNIPDEVDEVIQPLIPQPIHTTPPNDDYVAPATKSILDELLEEFSDKILNVTMVDKER
ncbi:hypothetical protein Tco_0397483 [Tanacetum coccineum]